ncbi:MAG: beta-lactamase family protein [Planctomycetes bacterium]|nr:beta-lactamase family protein [Planctomycetota bacterium]
MWVLGMCVALGFVLGDEKLAEPAKCVAVVEALGAELCGSEAAARVTIVVAEERRIVVARGFAAEATRKPDPAAAIALGALSHTFTAAAALVLVDDKKLDLRAPVTTILPELDASFRGVELRDLLYGTSRAAPANEKSAGPTAFVARGPVRSRQELDGVDWTLVARAIEAASKSKHDDFVAKRVLEPSGLSATKPCAPAESSPEFESTPQDLVNWMQVLLARSLLSERSTHQYMSPIELTDGNLSAGGMGLCMSKVRGLKRYRLASHRGARRIELSYWSQTRATVLIVAEDLDGDLDVAARRAAERLFELPPLTLKPIDLDAAAAQRVVGDWRLGGRTLSIASDGARLTVKGDDDERSIALIPLSPVEYARSDDLEARIVLPDGTGRAELLTVRRGGRDFTARRPE